MIHLRSIGLKPAGKADAFPFTIPLVKNSKSFKSPRPSLLLRRDGTASRRSSKGRGCRRLDRRRRRGRAPRRDARPRAAARRALKSSAHRTHRGFFLRAEDFSTSPPHQPTSASSKRWRRSSRRADGLRAAARAGLARARRALAERYGEDADAARTARVFSRCSLALRPRRSLPPESRGAPRRRGNWRCSPCSRR